MGADWFETKELYRTINGSALSDLCGFMPEHDELKDALEDMTGGRSLTVRGLARILSYRVGRIVQGRKLAKVMVSGRTRFRLEKVTHDV